MKNLILIVSFSLFTAVFFSCKSVSKGNVPADDYEPLYAEKTVYVDVQTPYFNVNNEKSEYIDNCKLKKDIEYLKYIIRTCYAGYITALGKGFDIDSAAEKIERKLAQDGRTVSVNDFQKEIILNFSKYIDDSHFYVHNGDSHFKIASEYVVYYSNTYLRKEGDGKFKVYVTDDEKLKTGVEYKGEKSNLFYYPSRGKNVWRLGVVSSSKLSESSFRFSTGEIKLPIHTETAISTTEHHYNELYTEKTAYFSFSDFFLEKDFLYPFNEIEKRKNIIIDLRSNCGGVLKKIGTLLLLASSGKNVDEYTDCLFAYYLKDSIQLESPGELKANIDYMKYYFPEDKDYLSFLNERLYEMKKHPEVRLLRYGDIQKIDESFKPEHYYDRKLIFLIDRNTASASEMLVLLAKKIFEDVIVLGENTKGCFTYGGILEYQLPDSKLVLSLAQTSLNPFASAFKEWKGEGRGIYPDGWTSREDLIETIVKVTDDDELYSVLKGIHSGLK